MKTKKRSRKVLKQIIEDLQKLYDKGAGISNFELTNEIIEDPMSENWKEYISTGHTTVTIRIYDPSKDQRPLQQNK